VVLTLLALAYALGPAGFVPPPSASVPLPDGTLVAPAPPLLPLLVVLTVVVFAPFFELLFIPNISFLLPILIYIFIFVIICELLLKLSNSLTELNK